MTISRLVRILSISVSLSTIALSGNVWSSADEPDIETYGYAHIDPQNTDIFTIDMPGETYDPLSGSIGHTFTDLSIPGNGQLPITLQRKFKEIPKAYPYAFGNMDLVVPYLNIEGFTGSATHTLGDDPNFVCALPNGNPTDSRVFWRTVSFNYEGGRISFAKKTDLFDTTQTEYPEKAIYVSPNNWILSCAVDNPAIFEVRSPDGTLYRLVQRERWATVRKFGINPDAKSQTSTFRIYVNEVKNHGTTLTYQYERPSDWGVRTHAVYPPIAQGVLAGDTNIIRNKYRLKRIIASNTLGTDSREVTITYRTANQSCPHLVDKVTSADTPGGSVAYSYVRNQNGSPKTIIDQCLLEKATFADNSYFHFRYGLHAQPHEFMNGSFLYGDQRRITAYIPLMEVTAPTGAAAQYTYMTLGTCEFQDSGRDHSAFNYNYANAAGCEGVESRRPALTYRDVKHVVAPTSGNVTTNLFRAESSIASFTRSEQTIEYEKVKGPGGENDLTPNEVIRRVVSGERTHELVYARIDRFGDPYGIEYGRFGDPTVDPDLTGRLTRSGKLMSHKVISNSSGNVLSNTRYTYAANMNFVDMAKVDYPRAIDPSQDAFGINNTVYQYNVLQKNWFFDVQRINLVKTAIDYNGVETITQNRSYDVYNYPERKDSLQRIGQTQISKTTGINYDHTRNSLAVWRIGLPNYIEVGQSNGGNVLDTPASPSAKTYRSYNEYGLLTSETRHGVETKYAYYGNGDLQSTTDGTGKKSEFKHYINGISRRTEMPNGGVMTRVLNGDGTVHEETDASGNKVNFRYDSAGRPIQTWVGGTASGVTWTSYPQWHSEGVSNQRMKTITQAGQNNQKVFYDALGRSKLLASTDLSGSGTDSRRVFTYDHLGRIIWISDPSPTPFVGDSSTWPGTVRHYDAFDRLVKSYHSSKPSENYTYCYGSTCNTNSNFNDAGTVTNGYMVRDPSNNVTAYDFRALGHPSNEELMSVSQQIDATEVVTTKMVRNIHGFITSVKQGAPADVGPNGSAPERTFSPFISNGSLTPWLKSETHPEFGTRTVLAFDGVGRPLKVKQFDDNFLDYTYDALGSVKTIKASGAGTPDSDLASYHYWPNGDIKSLDAAGTRWDYTYVPLKPQLLSEELTIDNDMSYLLTYGYDNFNRMNRLTYPDDTIVDYALNGSGLPTAVTVERGAQDLTLVTDVDYFANGQVNRIVHGNGQVFEATQDAQQRPEDWSVTNAENGLNPLDMSYSYDKRGNVKSINGYFGDTGQNLDGLLYDGLNRLIVANGSWGSASYNYDLQGNILHATHGALTQHYGYDATKSNQQLLSVSSDVSPTEQPAYSMQYDGNGNVENSGVMVMTYDPLNRMTTLDRSFADALSDKSFSYRYDGNNHRTVSTKSVDISADTLDPARSFSLTTHHIYSAGGDLLYEHDLGAEELRKHIPLGGRTIATLASHQSYDSDNDQIPDYYERLWGLNPLKHSDASMDVDNDGLNNAYEYLVGSSPVNTDTDNDGLPDAWEVEWALDPTDGADAVLDSDQDDVSNLSEYFGNSNPIDNRMTPAELMYLVPIMHQHAQ